MQGIEKKALKETSCMVSVDVPHAVVGEVLDEVKLPHFTLAYVRLSEDPDERAAQFDRIKDVVARLAPSIPPVAGGVLPGVDTFPTTPPKGKTWADMGEEPSTVVCRRPTPGFFGWLFATAHRLTSALERAGLPVSRFEKFEPHVTLHVIEAAEFAAYEAEGKVFDLGSMPEVVFDVDAIHLHRAATEHLVFPLGEKRALTASQSKIAGPLRDASKLRHQAVFMMGAGGSGKGFVAQQWLKYMPGAGETGATTDFAERATQKMTPQARSLSDLSFTNVVDSLKSKGVHIEPIAEGSSASLPFRLTDFSGKEIRPQDWGTLPLDVRNQLTDITRIVFSTPKHELPSYWRQANPDIFKEELPGYSPESPGYVHEMSSDMSKAYFEAVLETGDPIFVDGTGSNYVRMESALLLARAKGYRVSLVLVLVDLTANQIRNATRSRVVNPVVVAEQWHKIKGNFANLKDLADKSSVILNKNDRADADRYNKDPEKVDSIIYEKSGGRYLDLRHLISEESPREIPHWDGLLRWTN